MCRRMSLCLAALWEHPANVQKWGLIWVSRCLLLGCQTLDVFGEATAYLSELDASGCLTHPFHRQLGASRVWERT